MTYQPSHDSEWEATIPNFSLDLAFGGEAEAAQSRLWRLIREDHHRVEVKHERRTNGCHYIETHQRPRGADQYSPSGLLTTGADIWVVFAGSPISGAHVYIVQDLRTAWQLGQLGSVVDGGRNGDNPTKGHVVPFVRLDQVIERNKKERVSTV